MGRLGAAVAPERRGARSAVLVAVALVGVVSCAQPEPVGEPPAAQPTAQASDGGGIVDGGSVPDPVVGPEAAAEPDGGETVDGGSVPDPEGGLEATVEPSDGDPDGGEGVWEATVEPSGVDPDGGEGVLEGGSGSGGSGRFRQPGELVGRPGVPGAVVGEGAGLLRSEHSPWEVVMGEVFDVCDPGFVPLIIDRMVGSGYGLAELYVPVNLKLEGYLWNWCGSGGTPRDGMPRYAHMTWRGPGPARLSPEEATDAVQEVACLYGCGHNLGGGGMQLGYEAPHDVFAVDAPVDEVVVLWDSVAVRDGELLGLVQNRSAALFAREVTVTLGEHGWVFPLTVQPGEVAPFVLGAGSVSVLPERSAVEVSAALSPQPDLSRSFFGDIFTFQTLHSSAWETSLFSRFLAEGGFGPNVAAVDDLPPDPDVWVREWQIRVDLVEPNSHPGLVGASAVEDLVIEDMRAYLTFLDEHRRVFAVQRLIPDSAWTDLTDPLRLPFIDSDGSRYYDFDLDFYWLADSEYDTRWTVMHVGGAGPWTRTGGAGP